MGKVSPLSHEERLAMTRRKMEARQSLKRLNRSNVRILNDIDEADEFINESNNNSDICPNCKSHGIIHESGCVKCINCGWTRC